MIYLYKGKDNVLINLEEFSAINNTEIKKEIPIASNSFGMYEDYPFDINNIDSYRKKSSDHEGCLNYKNRNIFQKGFVFLNREASRQIDITDINSNGESLYDIIVQAGAYFLETGNAYLEAVKVGNSKPMIYVANPKKCRAVINKSKTAIKNYLFLQEMGRAIPISATKANSDDYRFLYHIKNVNTMSQIYGVPDWYSVTTAIDIHYGIDMWLKSFLNNNARFDFLIVTEGRPLNKESEKRLKDTLGKAKGLENKGRGGYLSVGADTKVHVIELNKVNHSSFFEGKDKYSAQIIRNHSLSPSSVGFSSGGSSIAGNEIIGALRKDYETYISPLQEYFAQKMNNLLYLIYGVNPEIKFKKMDVVSEKDQAIIDNIYLSSNVISRTYIRRVRFPDILDNEIDDAEKQTIETSENKKPFLGEHPTNWDSTENYLIDRS